MIFKLKKNSFRDDSTHFTRSFVFGRQKSTHYQNQTSIKRSSQRSMISPNRRRGEVYVKTRQIEVYVQKRQGPQTMKNTNLTQEI